MIKKVALSLTTFALAIALGATKYRVNLPKPAVVAGTELKAGDYKVEIIGDKAILKNGKSSVETDVSVENGANKYYETSACCLAEDGKYRLQELRIGGTNTKLLFKNTPAGGAVAGH
jgi:hypothetical protein